MKVGVLAHLCGVLPPDQLAERVANNGYSYVQLAIWKAFEGMGFDLPGQLSPGLGNYVAEHFAKHDVSIPVLGCYLRLFERDEHQQRAHIERFKEHLRHARHFGASIVAVEVGKPDPGTSREDNWSRLMEALSELTEEAERWGTIIGIEPAENHLIEKTEQLVQCMDELQSSNIGFVLDPANLMNARNFKHQDDVIKNAFELLGHRIVHMHLKDTIQETENGPLKQVHAGGGQLNYPLFLSLADRYKPHCTATMEEVNDATFASSINFIKDIRRQNAAQ